MGQTLREKSILLNIRQRRERRIQARRDRNAHHAKDWRDGLFIYYELFHHSKLVYRIDLPLRLLRFLMFKIS